MALVKINDNPHALLREISEKRKQKGEANNSMAAILHEQILKLHKKECKK